MKIAFVRTSRDAGLAPDAPVLVEVDDAVLPCPAHGSSTRSKLCTRRLPVAVALSKAPRLNRNRLIALRKILLLPTDEWPNPRRAEVQRVEDGIFVLKAKPSQWRIYFAPIDAEQRFILLLAVEKKKDERNPNDIGIAKRLLDAYRTRQAGAVPITFNR